MTKGIETILADMRETGLAWLEEAADTIEQALARQTYEYATGHQIWTSDDTFELRPKYRKPDEATAREGARKSQENGDNLVAMRIPVVEWELLAEQSSQADPLAPDHAEKEHDNLFGE